MQKKEKIIFSKKMGDDKIHLFYNKMLDSQVKSKGSYRRTYQNNKKLCETYRIDDNFSRYFNNLFIRVEVSK